MLTRLSRRTSLALAILLAGGVAIVMFLLVAPGRDLFSQGADPTPDSATATWLANAGSEKATIEARAAAIQTNPPTACPECITPVFDGPTPTPFSPYPHIPAGDGFIMNTGLAPFSAGELMVENRWYRKAPDQTVVVFAGSDGFDPSQGVVHVVIDPGPEATERPEGSGRYLTPSKSGAVRIVGAEGEVLRLEAENGDTFYFDVASTSFVDHEPIPTVDLGTPVLPDWTPQPVGTADAPQ